MISIKYIARKSYEQVMNTTLTGDIISLIIQILSFGEKETTNEIEWPHIVLLIVLIFSLITPIIIIPQQSIQIFFCSFFLILELSFYIFFEVIYAVKNNSKIPVIFGKNINYFETNFEKFLYIAICIIYILSCPLIFIYLIVSFFAITVLGFSFSFYMFKYGFKLIFLMFKTFFYYIPRFFILNLNKIY